MADRSLEDECAVISWEWVGLSTGEREREQAASGGCLSGDLAWNDSGCLEWALCVFTAQRTQGDSMSYPHIPSFLLAAVTD